MKGLEDRTDIRYNSRVQTRRAATRGRSRLKKSELAWLAGFIDGEGTIFVVREKRPKGRIVLKGRMSVDNTDVSNIRRVERLITCLTGRRPYLQITNVSRGYRPCQSLRLNRVSDVAVVLTAILPFLIGKRRRARLMLWFIAAAPRSAVSGRDRERKRTRDNMRWATCYTPRQFALAAEIRRLNRRYARGEWDRLERDEARISKATIGRAMA